MIIGITGGTGCGKTTALHVIRSLGGVIIDCDGLYHELLKTDGALLSAIGRRFPGVVVGGVLQRKLLGSLVFADRQALQDLNSITHGAVKKAVEEILAEQPPLAAIDAIALIESGLSELCDVTVAVTAPEPMRVQRLMARESIPEAYAISRIRAQKSNRWFAENCDFVLENLGTEAVFREKCLAFFQGLGIMNP